MQGEGAYRLLRVNQQMWLRRYLRKSLLGKYKRSSNSLLCAVIKLSR